LASPRGSFLQTAVANLIILPLSGFGVAVTSLGDHWAQGRG
jgi:hypothetical protein